MKPEDLVAAEMRVFIPARDFDLSKRFYRAIGFNEDWTNAEQALFRKGPLSFYVREEFNVSFKEHVLMHLLVRNVDQWWEQIQPALKTFRLQAEGPQNRPWGARDFVLSDPSDVRWRIAEAGR